ncbi:MAG: hypothetical protein ABJN65_14845 [Parasphingorhabdus sp.]
MLARIFIILCGVVFALTSCQGAAEKTVAVDTNIVAVVGAIHGQHKRSERYSLDVLQQAIRAFDPDVVLVELPPERFQKASENFNAFGEVRESRADDFPELTKVVFPLRREMGFTMVPVAAWSKSLADDRRAKLQQLENDPKRARDWSEYQTAIAAYNQSVSGKSDDPQFVHSKAYDDAVKARQETYERLFGEDLGLGGWTKINDAHVALIKQALDDVSGQQQRILILYGAWHKYKIREHLESRSDILIFDATMLF